MIAVPAVKVVYNFESTTKIKTQIMNPNNHCNSDIYVMNQKLQYLHILYCNIFVYFLKDTSICFLIYSEGMFMLL